jgi:hypothetical protein
VIVESVAYKKYSSQQKPVNIRRSSGRGKIETAECFRIVDAAALFGDEKHSLIGKTTTVEEHDSNQITEKKTEF